MLRAERHLGTQLKKGDCRFLPINENILGSKHTYAIFSETFERSLTTPKQANISSAPLL
jgi:hypothetical protein